MNSSNHITVMSFYAKHRRTGCYKIGSYSFAQLESSGHLVVLILFHRIQHIIFLQKYIQVYFLSDLPYIASELDIKESLVELMKHINDLHERLGNMIRSKLLWILWLCLELFGVAMAILLDDWPHLIPILAIAVMIHLSHAIYWNYMSRRTETKRRILIEEFNEKCNYNFSCSFYHSQDR